MWADTENSIRKVLDTIGLLEPISVRIVLNRHAGQPLEPDLRLYSIGKTNSAFEAVDSRFYGIMGTQKILNIPSIRQSTLLSNLSFGEGSAVFYPLNSRFGYCGFIWACFSQERYSEQVQETFTACCGWAEMLVRNWLDETLSVQSQANHYLDLMERLRMPALIMILPDRLVISNPAFEGMKEKESFLNALRREPEKPEDSTRIFSEFNFILKKIEFSDRQNARIYVFPNTGRNSGDIHFGENEIEYYRLLTQKALGSLSLLESTGEMSNMQKNYISRTESPLNRLESLFAYSEKHNQRKENSEVSSEILSVTDIAKEVIYDQAASARKKRIEIELDTDAGAKGRTAGNAVGDPWLLTLAVYDLLDNAIRFTPMDGKPIRVSILYNEKDWSLRVEDFGSGIAPLDLEQMQAQNYAEAAAGGLRGIALVKYVAKAHNGKLEIESRLGKGSVFTLTIPYITLPKKD